MKITKRASLALLILLGLGFAGCGGGSNGPSQSNARGPAPSASELSGRIVYAQSFRADDDATGRSSLYVADADGTNIVRLTPPNLNTNNSSGRVSGDGSQVIFGTIDRNSDTFPLYIVGLDGSGLQRADANFRAGALSPDEQTVAYSVSNTGAPDGNRRSEIFLAPADGSGTPRMFPSVGQYNDTPSFSPDGRSLIFVASNVPGMATGSSAIYLAPADGSGSARLLVSSDEVLSSPVFSPDGRHFAYTQSFGQSDRFGGQTAIYVADSEGRDPRLVAEGVDIFGPVFSPDGRFIAYPSGSGRLAVPVPDQAVVNIYIARADGSSESRLFQPEAGRGSQYAPQWVR